MLLVLLTTAIVSTRAEAVNEAASGVVNDYRFVSHAGESNYVKLHTSRKDRQYKCRSDKKIMVTRQATRK